MDSYSRIKLNIKTATRFRKFSEQIAGSHSEALTIMMDFFDQNKISPAESLGPNMKTLENNLKGRINALIAIIKNIEKKSNQTNCSHVNGTFRTSTQKTTTHGGEKKTTLKRLLIHT